MTWGGMSSITRRRSSFFPLYTTFASSTLPLAPLKWASANISSGSLGCLLAIALMTPYAYVLNVVKSAFSPLNILSLISKGMIGANSWSLTSALAISIIVLVGEFADSMAFSQSIWFSALYSASSGACAWAGALACAWAGALACAWAGALACAWAGARARAAGAWAASRAAVE